MYSRILVPVDGSSCSLKGLTEALKLASAPKTRVKVIHVVNELISEPALAATEYHQALIESMRETGKDVLAQAQSIARLADADVDTELLETIGGRASDCIVEAAKQWHADLIVMGTHGRRGMSRLTLGSDAELVVRSAPVPVLLVRERTDI
ncbi:universal stress protein [Peristeroidobacter soli]|jgi:nucleotide-binding universal stress UspA family protein|uniref:universal stress protein n=1 Tax=Peristeroidobacter soli TaxID=2497877 RepID=UPI00101B8DB7|nr:universal stress protein [Peristeroidobacter soli]